MKDIQTLIKFLSNLGLNFEQSKIYLALVEHGGQTILQISRATKISRTNVYRHIEDLKTRGLVEEVLKENKKLIFAVGAERLEILIKEEETKVDFLKKILPELSKFLSPNQSIAQPGTKVVLYQGAEGIKQMAWNTTKATRECVGFSFRHFPEIVGNEFTKKWRDEFIVKRLKFRELVSDTYIASLKKVEKDINYPVNNFEMRYISPVILDITYQMDIYNDVVSFYGWYEEEIFGVEITNAKIAKMQKQLFEIVWKISEEFKLDSSTKVANAQYRVKFS